MGRRRTKVSLRAGCHGSVAGVWNASFGVLVRALLPQDWTGCLSFILFIYGLVSCFMVTFLVLFLPLGSNLCLKGNRREHTGSRHGRKMPGYLAPER